jgi:hypothetical protein
MTSSISESYQIFLAYLLAQFSHPITLIQDGARYHISKATSQFTELHKKSAHHLTVARVLTRLQSD